MFTKTSFDAEDKTIGDILFANHEYKFRVPKYQRPYSWDQDQVQEFYSDITQSDNFFFLGTFVFNNEFLTTEAVLDIIDGQQRLITTTLLMASLRDIAKEIHEDELANLIQRKCIAFEDKRGKQTYRLICGDSLKEFFQKYIQQYNTEKFPEKIIRNEHRLIRDNYNFLKSIILQELEIEHDKKEYIHKIWDKVEYINTIWVSIGSDVDAYMIFETVNARGMELSVADLLKNLIFQKTQAEGKELNITREKWANIENLVETAKFYDKSHLLFSKFLRHFWLSKYSYITERKLYKEIKNKVKNYSDFLDTLEDSAQWYNVICSDSRELWSNVEYGIEIFKSLEGIRAMESTQCNVLFLSLLSNLKKIEFDISFYFKIIENFTFIYSSIGKQPASRVEQLYSRASQDLEKELSNRNVKNRDKRIHSILDKLIQELRKIKPIYPIFEESFKALHYTGNGSNGRFLRYILSKINESYGTGELKINFNNVNIEHILPQKPNSEWGFSKEEIKPYVNLLGNLTVVSTQINSKVGNTLKNKIELLEGSEIYITKRIAGNIRNNNYTWGQKQIEERQRELANIAYHDIWNF